MRGGGHPHPVGGVDVPAGKILQELPHLAEQGITELTIHDRRLAGDREALAAIVRAVRRDAPELFLTLPVEARCLNATLADALSQVDCSVEVPMEGTVRTESDGTHVLLFDRKLYATKAGLLNRLALVFGFDMGWGVQPGDTFRAFRERLDFAVSLYPNHIDFPQFFSGPVAPAPTGMYSSKDLEFSREMAFACRAFYSCGRAVPWFNTVVRPLRIAPSAFFADFSEWMSCNNCSFDSGYVPEDAAHTELEKMQLIFLGQKLEEKHREHLYAAVTDMVRLHGAMSRVAGEGEECVVETYYHPDDVLSPEAAADIAKFCDAATMEPCAVRVYAGPDAPDYRVL